MARLAGEPAGVAEVDDLLSRGGMSSMLVTIWLILTAMAFGAVLEHTGMLQRLIQSALKAAKSTGSLIMTVVLSAIGIGLSSFIMARVRRARTARSWSSRSSGALKTQ